MHGDSFSLITQRKSHANRNTYICVRITYKPVPSSSLIIHIKSHEHIGIQQAIQSHGSRTAVGIVLKTFNCLQRRVCMYKTAPVMQTIGLLLVADFKSH